MAPMWFEGADLKEGERGRQRERKGGGRKGGGKGWGHMKVEVKWELGYNSAVCLL